MKQSHILCAQKNIFLFFNESLQFFQQLRLTYFEKIYRKKLMDPEKSTIAIVNKEKENRLNIWLSNFF